ncbi:hypothetical protein, partial [Bacteroides cellulosilyticus]|uniref:hypothetical protein n=1 Tax=Bacteroides cellulosilyticus TaxID=246787 RepID=UPI0034A1E521
YAICYGNGQEKYGNSALTRKNPYAGWPRHKDRQYLYGNYNHWDKGNKTRKDCYGKDQDLKGEVDPEENGCQDWKPKLYNDDHHQI